MSLEVVYCMILIDDGEYILSFAIGDRYIAVWRIDGADGGNSSEGRGRGI